MILNQRRIPILDPYYLSNGTHALIRKEKYNEQPHQIAQSARMVRCGSPRSPSCSSQT